MVCLRMRAPVHLLSADAHRHRCTHNLAPAECGVIDGVLHLIQLLLAKELAHTVWSLPRLLRRVWHALPYIQLFAADDLAGTNSFVQRCGC